MTTAQENNELVDSKQQVEQENNESADSKQQVDQENNESADSKPKDLEEQDDQHPEHSEMMESEQVNMEITNNEAADLKAVAEPAAESQGVVDPAAESQGVAEQVDSQGIIEPVESQGVVDPAESQQGAVEGIDSQGIIEPVVVQDAREEGNSQGVSEPVDSLPVSEPMDSQAASEPVDSQAAIEPMDSEPMDSQPTSAEHAHTQPAGEVTYSHVVTSERISEPIGSQGFSEQVATQVVSEPVQSLGVNEAMESQPISAELAHPQPLSEEDLYSHPVSSEHMHLQPVSQGLVYSQPVTSEHMHSHRVSGAEQVHAHAHAHAVGSELVPVSHVNMHLQHVGAELVAAHPHEVEFANSHGVGMEAPNAQPLATEITEYHQQTTPETQPNKRRKKKSIVWEHFTIETVGAGCRRACCKVCKQSFAYSTGSKVAGTSHLKRHIAKGTCPVILRQQEKNQLSPYTPKSGGMDASTDPPKRRYRSSNSQYLMFDQDRCRHEIARMIIMHDYPLHMVEHPGFVSFVQNLQPRFDMVSFNIVQGDCVATFLREKQNLQKFIEGIPGRMCLTLDMWTSSQSTGYVFVTGQFIDNDWKLHRRLLNVVMEPFPESDRALSHAVGTCLSDWGVERKLASVTFNQPLTETALENMRALLAVKNSMLLNGQLLIRTCLARTLSSMAQDVFAAGQETIKKIRSSVKYVMTSESHEEKFLELKQHLQVPTEKSLSLNNSTKWNTTYEMLLAASESKEVFSCLDTSDPDYKDAPSMEEWKQVENICNYLKLLYDAANMLTLKDAPSSNVFFHEVWKIQLELARASASEDPFVSDLARPLQDKFHKYWKSSCLVLAIAVAMDPRFKMKLVEFSFTKIFGEEAPVFIRVVDEGIHELFHEYGNLPLPLTPAYTEGANGGNVKSEGDEQGGGLLASNGLSDFDMYIMETTSQQMKSELDQYLEESLLPRVQDFDVLGWWKLNKMKYPTLSKMARDILALPLSTVPPESVFDTVVKEMDAYRCSLRPETVEALICAKDWLQRETAKVSDTKEIVKMEL